MENAPFYQIKVSEARRLLNKPFKTQVRMTGILDQYDQINKVAVLSSIEFDEKNNQKRHEIKVNFSMIDNFNINDYNGRFDLLQVGGYLKSITNRNYNDLLEFQVVFFRIFIKISLNSYYETIDLQRSYLRKNGYLKENEIFF
jgi:hypothetical protein